MTTTSTRSAAQVYRLDQSDASCPACHASQSVVLYTVGAAEAAQHYVLKEVSPDRHEALRQHIEWLWEAPTCDVVRCDACGFCFAHPYVAGDERFYTLAYERSGYPSWKWEYEQTRQAIQAMLPTVEEAPHLLEVGAGDGAFVKGVAPALIPKAQVLCTEYSAYGRSEIERYGISCVSQDVRDLSLERYGRSFDILCLFQVLEHLDRLDVLFEHLGALAKSRAHLFIAVPNHQRITFNERNGALLDMPPNHIGRWTEESFEAVAGRHGWELAAHEIEPEGAVAKATNYIEFRYMRARQDSRSFAQRAERLPMPARRPAQIALAGGYALGSPRALWRLFRAPDLGNHQWVHLTRD